jgi:endonuclease YncB( thermonuclease family)
MENVDKLDLPPGCFYAERIKRIVAAENEAREYKKGIWSDEMKEEREAEGWE